jgi:AcrR family transcriptional regulator
LWKNKQETGDLMKTEKTDRRVKYTKMALKQSLLELISDRPIGRVTIKEICDTADINRGTFYKHYNDQYDLMNEILSELDIETKAAFEHIHTDAANSAAVVAEIIRIIAAQSSLCKIICGDYSDKKFLRKLINNAREKFIERWKKIIKNADTKQLDMLYTFVANGVTAIIQNWLQGGMEESPDEIAGFIAKIENGICLYAQNWGSPH